MGFGTARRTTLLAVTVGALPLCSCSTSLPAVSAPSGRALASAAPIATTTTRDGEGLMSRGESAAALRAVRAEGRARQFDRHLAILQREKEILSRGNKVELLVDGPATFAAMFAELEKARHRILLESYIIEADEIGLRLRDTLLRKRAEGVEVYLIRDAVGSFSTPREYFESLREGGVRVCEFNPLSALRRSFGILQANHRDHRKVLVVDGLLAFTGGINVSRVYSSASPAWRHRGAGGMADGWRDTHVRIEGPAAAQFVDLFRDTWQRQHCPDAERLARSGQHHGAISTEPAGERLVSVIGSVAGANSDRLYRTLLGAIVGATDSIHITMAYFVPDPQTLDALAEAALRGVEVVLVLPGYGDSLLALRAGQSHYSRLLDAGVRIFEMHDAFLHAKTVVIDGVWSTVGSANLDWRSFLHNDELNVIVLGEDFGTRMEALFAADVARSRQLSPQEWSGRGVARQWMERFSRLWEYWL